jgi:N-acetyltransferase 10
MSHHHHHQQPQTTTKQIPPTLLTTLETSNINNHRSLILIVGDSSRDLVPHLHGLIKRTSQDSLQNNVDVLWCYKTSDLGLTEKRKKKMNKMKKLAQRGLYENETDSVHHVLERFFAMAKITYCFYKDTEKILGKTYGMLVLQDFEALTPNILARTMETVRGGGCIIMLLKKMESLRRLYSLTMDAHARFSTHGYSHIRPRFNERFILSLGACTSCVVIDEEFNLLPSLTSKSLLTTLSSTGQQQPPTSSSQTPDLQQIKSKQLSGLSLQDPIASLIDICRTIDQVTALKDILGKILNKSPSFTQFGGHTFTLQASRGRGKSALLGLIIAGALFDGLVISCYVSAPSITSIQTLYEFIIKGLTSLRFVEHRDFKIITEGFDIGNNNNNSTSTSNSNFSNKQILAIEIMNSHHTTKQHQYVRYIDPLSSSIDVLVSNADMIVIDEAAAIPLPLVKRLLPSVSSTTSSSNQIIQLLSSTVDGYEGTGRSLSLKLFKELKNEEIKRGRSFMEIKLIEPIRYGRNDPIELWLHDLLLLNAGSSSSNSEETSSGNTSTNNFPALNRTELFAVDRDTLFSRHRVSERMLQRIWSLFITSHYKNSPNDLQLLADAPAHRLYVLISVDSMNDVQHEPQILCAIQVAFEGTIPSSLVKKQLATGSKESGDLIPWQMAQQFQDDTFGEYRGVRVIRIATHPGAMGMGYGKRAMELLVQHFGGGQINNEITATNDDEFEHPIIEQSQHDDNEEEHYFLQDEKLRLRKKLHPLLVSANDLQQGCQCDYVGVAFGTSPKLFEFWRKCGFKPVYLRQTPNEATGEFSCIVLKPTLLAKDKFHKKIDG